MSEQVKHGNTKAQLGNENAVKDVKKESFLHIRCETKDKALWVKSANKEGKKLAVWVTECLNKAAKAKK